MQSPSETDRLAAVLDRRRSRRPEQNSGSELVRVSPGVRRPWQPALAEATVPGVDLCDWVTSHLHPVRELITAHGALVLRGMVCDVESFGRTVAEVAGDQLAEYTNRSTPRSRVAGRVFTSTEYSADHAIPMHSEQSYTSRWPLLLGFYGELPAETGGETPLAPTDQVLDLLPADLVDRFVERGVCYERWYHPNVGLPWTEVFQTEDPAEMQRICADSGIEVSWHEDGLLRTRQPAQVVTRHPVSGATVWFNQANLFHPAALPESVSGPLRRTYGERLPRSVSFGDGSPIPDEYVRLIEEAFTTASWRAPWTAGDVVLVDNVAVAHGRRPYTGARRVLVAMAGTGQADDGGNGE
ncbi:TauD/TfdA family dioxygenase [Micromonospora sp. NPDC049048]|uniref:TauD/TfdA family dioxygenase n=1 Tax=Micromonospora sp. NPDC049048 TaxID=3364263 RepID=UPI00371A9F8B